jgi:GTP-binding protein
MKDLRNVAIIAHVDHGKTTLVDALLRQSSTKLTKEFTSESSLIMDSNDLEKERGITIFSKNASVQWKGTKINIIDTPGHADFGGEVERVLKLADGCLLLIDAKEGPMPQTRFVLKAALALDHKVIVVINKIDKPDARVQEVINKTFDLFLELGADEDAAFFPIVYCSSKLGLAGSDSDLAKMTSISPVFEAILQHIPEPSGDKNKPLQMLVTSTTHDNFKGRIATGRLYNGSLQAKQEVTVVDSLGEYKNHRLTSLMSFQGLERIEVIEAEAGDIVAIAGIPGISIGETVTSPANPQRLPLLSIEKPTIRISIRPNSSPFAGREGEFKTSRQIQERLYKELESDVALKIEDTAGGWILSGRGELHLAVLIERMRREGYEFEASRPQVVEKNENGQTLTPFERVFIESPEEYAGTVMQKMGERRAALQNMRIENGNTYMEFIISTKDFFGFRSEFVTDTHGLGTINASFFEYRPDSGSSYNRENGSLVAHEAGTTMMYGLLAAQGRGDLFIGPGVPVYTGQVVGRNARSQDIRINVCKEKHLTNHRSKGDGVTEHFNAPMEMQLEAALEYIDDSELVEVTPKNIRIRKVNLKSF